MMISRKALTLWLLVAVLCGTAGFAHAQQPEREIVVTGVSDLELPPTVMELQITTLAIGPTGAQAADQAQARADEVITDFRQFGLQPNDWHQDRAVVRRPLPDEPRKMAFWATVALSVRLDDFTAATDMLDRASQLKAVKVEFDFELDEPAVAYENAIKHALDDAHRRAELIAREMNVTLGPLNGCEELSRPPGSERGRFMGFGRRTTQTDDADSDDDNALQPDRPMVLKPEMITVSATVRARYAIAR
jgi:uncharacterized protein YggE